MSAGTEIFQSGMCNEIPRGAGYWIAGFYANFRKNCYRKNNTRVKGYSISEVKALTEWKLFSGVEPKGYCQIGFGTLGIIVSIQTHFGRD